MLEIFAAIYIVKSYYKFANDLGRTGWLYGLLGFVLFYGVAIAITGGVYLYLFSGGDMREVSFMESVGISIVGILISGTLAMYVVLPLLRKMVTAKEPETLDGGMW